MAMMIKSQKEKIAETVLLPGDPLRAKVVAEKFLDSLQLFNTERGLLGYTGTYGGKRVSVLGTGMGIPAMSLCAHELITEYEVKNLIRIGTCGGIREDVGLFSVVIATTASSTANIGAIAGISGATYAPTADFELVRIAKEAAKREGFPTAVGSILTAELFHGEEGYYKKWAQWGCIAVEMETAALYIEAARHGAKALSLLTVSDHLVTFELTTAEQRQNSFTDMMKVALETAITV